jgi:hypothetical protein
MNSRIRATFVESPLQRWNEGCSSSRIDAERRFRPQRFITDPQETDMTRPHLIAIAILFARATEMQSNDLHAAQPSAAPGASSEIAANADCNSVLTPNQKKDEDTIRRIEHDWLAAEVQGNTRFLECLLGPDYVNIGKDGKTHPGSDIIAHVAKNKGKHLDIPPIESTIVVHDDAATAYSSSKTHDKDGQLKDVHFVDAFVFKNGQWHPYCGVDI